MKKFFIHSFNKEIDYGGGSSRMEKILLLFCSYRNILDYQDDFQIQLRDYFLNNVPPDRIYVICPEYISKEIAELFKEASEIYNYIPLFKNKQFEKSLFLIHFDKNGEFRYSDGTLVLKEMMDEIYNRALVSIFLKRGGLIISQKSHHFVFPSGKHCDRFLRTGNVLINGSEIMFIASSILRKFAKKEFKNIYCDTSSINSLAFAFVSLYKDLNGFHGKEIHIESFGSYKLFEESKFKAERESLFLISSSTSGSIINRMINDRKKSIELSNIAIIYGLDVEKTFDAQVVCDLTHNLDTNPEGLKKFNTYNVVKGDKCVFCSDNSLPVPVEGDVFLLEKPNIISQLIYKADAPAFLGRMRDFYRQSEKDQAIFRAYFKENSEQDKNYEIYLDIDVILNEWPNRKKATPPYKAIFDKLEKYVLQYIPASLKYMVVLSDNSSLMLAKIIREIINEHGISFSEDSILRVNEIGTIDPVQKGSIAIISSSIVTGRNLLYLSRALRDYEQNLQRIFFTLISRTPMPQHLEFLDSNLGLGEFGKGTHKVINVETIHCVNEAHVTAWHEEKEFILLLNEFLEEHSVKCNKTLEYCVKREQEFNESGKNRGFENNLFFPHPIKDDPLKIRKGFVFAPNQRFIETSSQSEIFFIMSCVVNELKCKGRLSQSEYVRNVIDPGNFVRFNDGIIQASILRSGGKDDFRYDLSLELSLQMQSVLGDMINHLNDPHAEGLTEIFYAIAIKKLRLNNDTLLDCIKLLENQDLYKNQDCILKGIVEYIKVKVLERESIQDKFANAATKLEKNVFEEENL
ncbi:MAG: hypothetical protein V4677_11145 [Bacteroidota bacterium]